MKQVGIFAATRWELDAVQRALSVDTKRWVGGARCVLARKGACQVWLVRTGIGPARSEALCRRVLSVQPIDVVISTGFACALIPSQVGELLIGTQAVRHDRDEGGGVPQVGDVLECDPSLTHLARETAIRLHLRAQSGRFVTSSRVACLAKEKGVIRAMTGGVGLDMESAAVGTAATERRVPFIVVRAVSDLVDEDLPLDFNLFLAPGGWVRGAASLLSHPWRISGLIRLKDQSASASDRLTAFFGSFVESLGLTAVQ